MDLVITPRRFPVLRNVHDNIVHAINEAATVRRYTRNELVFQKGEVATAIYFLLAGKALFQAEAKKDMTVFLGALRPGYVFGWSAVFPGHKHHHTVVCAEPSDIAAVSSDDIQKILESNQCGGYTLLRNIFQLANERLELRTDQLLKLFESNPQMEHLQP